MDADLDISTRFARSLGLYEEGRWSLDAPPRTDLTEDELTSAADTLVNAVARPGRRGSVEDSGNFSYLANDDSHSLPSPPTDTDDADKDTDGAVNAPQPPAQDA